MKEKIVIKTMKPVYYSEKRFAITQKQLLGPIMFISISMLAELLLNGLTPLIYFGSGFDLCLIMFLFAVLKETESNISIQRIEE